MRKYIVVLDGSIAFSSDSLAAAGAFQDAVGCGAELYEALKTEHCEHEPENVQSAIPAAE